jgi:hypothetical protein
MSFSGEIIMNRREIVEEEIEYINQEISLVLRGHPNEGYRLWCSMNDHNPEIYSSRKLYANALKKKTPSPKSCTFSTTTRF